MCVSQLWGKVGGCADGEGKEESTTSVHEPCARVCMRDASALRGKVCPSLRASHFLFSLPPLFPPLLT